MVTLPGIWLENVKKTFEFDFERHNYVFLLTFKNVDGKVWLTKRFYNILTLLRYGQSNV